MSSPKKIPPPPAAKPANVATAPKPRPKVNMLVRATKVFFVHRPDRLKVATVGAERWRVDGDGDLFFYLGDAVIDFWKNGSYERVTYAGTALPN